MSKAVVCVLMGVALTGTGRAAPLPAPIPVPLAAPENDYPTAARSDYVLACMAVNGGTRTALESCSCSIDVIASVLPYARYEEADTILRMRQIGGGYLASEFRADASNEMLRTLREAQAEAEVLCF